MNNDLMMIARHKGYNIEIYSDHDAESPFDYSDLGTLIHHSKYTFARKNCPHIVNEDINDIEELIDKNKDNWIFIPVNLLDHSGISVSTNQFSCPWDSGQIGYIYISKDKIREIFNVERISSKLLKDVYKYLDQQIKSLDSWLKGEYCGYIVKDDEGSELDSCWGYESSETAIEMAVLTINEKHSADVKFLSEMV